VSILYTLASWFVEDYYWPTLKAMHTIWGQYVVNILYDIKLFIFFHITYDHITCDYNRLVVVVISYYNPNSKS